MRPHSPAASSDTLAGGRVNYLFGTRLLFPSLEVRRDDEADGAQ